MGGVILRLLVRAGLLPHCRSHLDRAATYHGPLGYYCDECQEHNALELDYADSVRDVNDT